MLNPRIYLILLMLGVIVSGGMVLRAYVTDEGTIKYVSLMHPDYYIQLNPDRTFQEYQGQDNSLSGTWKISENKLFLNGTDYSFVLKRNGTEVIDNGGKVWTKK